jgi:hypothetical protein
MRKSIGPAVAALSLGLATFALPGAASAITFTNTIGGATTGTGPYTLTSTDSTFSVLRFVNNEAFNFSDLTSLSLDYNVLLGGVGGGAPRLVVVTDADHNGVEDGDFTIHLGPPGSFVDPSLGAHNSGNLLAMNDVGRYDLGDLGLSAYTNYAAALAAAGSYGVVRVSLVLDSFGGADKTIVVGASGLSALTAVPEPAAWLLMIGGFGLVGATLRRRNNLLARA